MISSWLLSSQRISLRKPGSHPFCWFLTNLASFCSCWTKCWFFVPSAMAGFISYHWHCYVPWYLWFHFFNQALDVNIRTKSLVLASGTGHVDLCQWCQNFMHLLLRLAHWCIWTQAVQILGRCGHFANVKQHIFKRRTLSTQSTKIQYKLLEICA